MANYRFDGRTFIKTFFTFLASGVFIGALFGVFWEEDNAIKLTHVTKESLEKEFLGLIVRDALIGLGIGGVLGLVMGGIGSFGRHRDRGIWGE